MKDLYQTIPGVQSISLAFRGLGAVGAIGGGNRFELLALESQYFPYIAWYRDDFSSGSLQTVMGDLLPREANPPIVIPEGAETLSVWVKSAEAYDGMFLWAIIMDDHGTVSTQTFGALDNPDWRQLTVDIPDVLQHPLHLESIQVFERAFGPAGRPGSIWLDDIQVDFGPGRDPIVLDDFEGEMKWTPLATSMLSSDRVGVTSQDVHNGTRSGVFSFGKDTDRGIRGFYRSPTGGPLSVVGELVLPGPCCSRPRRQDDRLLPWPHDPRARARRRRLLPHPESAYKGLPADRLGRPGASREHHHAGPLKDRAKRDIHR